MMDAPMPVRLAALAFAALLPLSAAHAQRGPAARSDAYGYLVASDPASCPYAPVDVSGSPPLVPVAADGSPSASDDGHATVLLAAPFELYGVALQQFAMSTNGYLSGASGPDEDDGGDFSNDCPLPAAPDHVGAGTARILAWHDDLAAGVGGALRSSSFASCPRIAASGVDEACSVFDWSGWTRVGHADGLAFQVVLYHASFEIALQYIDTGDGGVGATIGAQDAGASSAVEHACNGTRALPSAHSVCLFDPRFPPLSTLDVIFTDGFEGPP
jgi:hypothetical protein